MKRTSSKGSSGVVQVNISKKVIFETKAVGIEKGLSSKDTIGDAIEKLLALATSDLPYVRAEILKFLPGLLANFRDFRFFRSECVRGISKQREVEVKSAALSDLDYALLRWIESFLALEDHLLLPTYGLACAKFISAHLYGAIDFNDGNWQIEGMLDSSYENFHFFHDPQFKKHVTRHIGHTIAVVRVPEKSAIIVEGSKIRIESGAEFLFKIQRCHLSTGLYDNSYFSINQPETDFDLFNDFNFRGGIMFKPSKRTDFLPEEFDFQEISGEIPVTWISHLRKDMINKTNQEALPGWIRIH